MSRRTCFLVGLVLAVFVVPLQAQPVRDVRIAPGVTTHMGQVASDHVVLHSVSIATDEFEFRRISLDGLGDASAFMVPADQVLVVTDVSARNINGPAGGGILIQLIIDNLANPPVYESLIEQSGGGDGGTSDGMTIGFIVAPGLEVLRCRLFCQREVRAKPPSSSEVTLRQMSEVWLLPDQHSGSASICDNAAEWTPGKKKPSACKSAIG